MLLITEPSFLSSSSCAACETRRTATTCRQFVDEYLSLLSFNWAIKWSADRASRVRRDARQASRLPRASGRASRRASAAAPQTGARASCFPNFRQKRSIINLICSWSSSSPARNTRTRRRRCRPRRWPWWTSSSKTARPYTTRARCAEPCLLNNFLIEIRFFLNFLVSNFRPFSSTTNSPICLKWREEVKKWEFFQHFEFFPRHYSFQISQIWQSKVRSTSFRFYHFRF